MKELTLTIKGPVEESELEVGGYQAMHWAYYGALIYDGQTFAVKAKSAVDIPPEAIDRTRELVFEALMQQAMKA